MRDPQFWEVVAIEPAIARDELGGVMKGMGGDEEISDDAVPRPGGGFAVFEEDRFFWKVSSCADQFELGFV